MHMATINNHIQSSLYNITISITSSSTLRHGHFPWCNISKVQLPGCNVSNLLVSNNLIMIMLHNLIYRGIGPDLSGLAFSH